MQMQYIVLKLRAQMGYILEVKKKLPSQMKH